ncbi:class E basic helix-loop-helix protein 23-like [Mercenaria mercenaria]|uniref:class E basic helix-loop-helix protein 23-like n=1 Tax=Mercenaria mercenaria TaxID=6596 RepID=UPI00234EBE92|nr:class E basic helix-loop-helix protein 23-like [Mercenaria mercenaria]
MSLSYNIDKLLEKSAGEDDTVENTDTESFNQSFSENDENSDDDKSISPPYIRKYDRRHKSRVPEDVRLRVNCRERQRMHDLNSALDSLRQTLPYSHGPSVKKISKMATLILARNYIVMLNKSLDEMRKLVTDISMKQTSPTNIPVAPVPSAISPERISPASVSVSALTPFSAGLTASHPVLSNDIPKQLPTFAQLNSLYAPYKVSAVQQTTSAHGHVSPLCPCNFCQVSLASLPKPDWKKSC